MVTGIAGGDIGLRCRGSFFRAEQRWRESRSIAGRVSDFRGICVKCRPAFLAGPAGYIKGLHPWIGAPLFFAKTGRQERPIWCFSGVYV